MGNPSFVIRCRGGSVNRPPQEAQCRLALGVLVSGWNGACRRRPGHRPSTQRRLATIFRLAVPIRLPPRNGTFDRSVQEGRR
jgi:hypothetical protein